jgi:2-oxo-4-hydroxy-4-carboxy--5-ureidoimidazoline (OHCU) decarboxylase
MRARDYIEVTKYEDINRGIASHDYASLAGMLVATVKWGAKSIRTDTSFALDILQQALIDKEKVDDVVERYNRRFNVKHKKV